jgi:hypothetical protein
MCDHDGTATGILRFSKTRPGMLEPALLCEACETIITQFAPLPHRGTRLVPNIAAVLESELASIAETYQNSDRAHGKRRPRPRNRRRLSFARLEHTTPRSPA